MAAVANPPRTAQSAPADRIILHDVSWAAYESLLANYVDRQTPRLAYDRGTLEIVVTLSSEHERDNRTLALLIEIVAAELAIDVLDVGGTTYRREDVKRGFEPDSSFYIQNEARVRGRRRIDPTVDPPPDLIIEVDVTSYSLSKFPLYAGLGIPEVWRYERERIIIHVLQGDAYAESPASIALPPLTSEILSRFLEESRSFPRTAWLRSVQAWARQQGAVDRPMSSP